MDNLKVFSNGVDSYVAESPEGAVEEFKKFIGDEYVPLYGEIDDWYECDPDASASIHFEDEQKIFPESFEVLERGDYYIRIKAKYREWAVFNGKGFLCSTEF